MKKSLKICIVVVFLSTALVTRGNILPTGLAFYKQGAVTLSNPGDYDWWYGCSPTSAGMIIGHYDVAGYNGHSYSNLVPGGQAENSTFGSGPYLVNNAIASPGHIEDFYSNLSSDAGYGLSGDDLPPPWHSFDCLADFMGTSQDIYENSNGETTFYYWTDGTPFTSTDAAAAAVADFDGMYGMGEYLRYAGYDAATLYTQHIYSPDAPLGFTFEQYVAEIDAGRPVMIQVEGHSMYGYGYDAANNTVLLHDTWSLGEHSMTWGGSYAGMQQWGVVALTPVPEPATICLLGLGSVVLLRKRRA
jgi:hypothetical protein